MKEDSCWGKNNQDNQRRQNNCFRAMSINAEFAEGKERPAFKKFHAKAIDQKQKNPKSQNRKKTKIRRGAPKMIEYSFIEISKSAPFHPQGLCSLLNRCCCGALRNKQQDNNDNKINCDKDKNISDNDNYDKDKKNLSDDNKNDNNSHVTGALRYFHYVWPFIHSSMLAS